MITPAAPASGDPDGSPAIDVVTRAQRLLDSLLAQGAPSDRGHERRERVRARIHEILIGKKSSTAPAEDAALARVVGSALLDLECFEPAARAYRLALTGAPDEAALHADLAFALLNSGRSHEGLDALRNVVRCEPNEPRWRLNLGSALAMAGSSEQAISEFRRAAQLDPLSSEPWKRMGQLQTAQRLHRDALTSFRRALELNPQCVASLSAMAQVCDALDMQSQAIECLGRLADLRPDIAELHNNLGAACMKAGRYEDALPALQKAVQLNGSLAIAQSNLGTVLESLGHWPDALRAHRRAAHLQPDFLYARVHALTMARELAAWAGWDSEVDALRRTAPAPGNSAPQLDLLYLPLPPALLRAHAEAYAAERAVGMPSQGRLLHHRVHSGPIRVGYVSDELRLHALGTLLVEVLELHDRDRFEVHLYCWGDADGSVIERRAHAAASIHDITALTARQAAEKIAADGIDILVDLKGYTLRPRTEIFAHRPAAVQVSWLGYPGTMGSSLFDYLLADEHIVPSGTEQHYSETIVRLPDTYQPNDRQRRATAPKTRTEYGLPLEATVFCYLGKVSKIIPDTFDDWMLILKSVPGSVLWLLAERLEARTNLFAETQRRGVDADRLRFAAPTAFAEHLARFKVADVALDTFPYGSHTTASEALWQACPLVTRAGDTFASRVAGSLLRAAGMPELVTNSAEGFRNLAIELGNDPERRMALRARLEATRATCALFDTPRFVRNLEAAYTAMHSRATRP